MKRIIVFMFVFVLFSGCATITTENLSRKTDIYIENLRKSSAGKTHTFGASYPETFQAVISVFRDVNIKLLDKNFEGKLIYGSFYPNHYGNHRVAFFKDKGNKTEIRLIATGAFFKDEYYIDKIQEEIILQRKLNENE